MSLFPTGQAVLQGLVYSVTILLAFSLLNSDKLIIPLCRFGNTSADFRHKQTQNKDFDADKPNQQYLNAFTKGSNMPISHTPSF